LKNILSIFVTEMDNTLQNHIQAPVLTRETFLLLQQENKEQSQEIDRLKADNLYLRQELEKLKRMLFGAKSERFVSNQHPSQLILGLETAPQEADEPEKETISYERNKPVEKPARVHSRQALPAHLPRKEEIIEPAEDTTGAKKIGEEITEVLEYTPGQLYVRKIIRPKYALPREEKSIVIADMPSLPIPKGNAGASLISHIITSKFVDHLPFYRQVQIFKRQDVCIAESSINDWFAGGCRLMEPLYEKLAGLMVRGSYLMADETPIPVLDKDKPGTTHRGYHWVYYSPLDKLVCFNYQKGRGREGPKAFLEDFQGALQTDGYVAYDNIGKPGKIYLLACMAHARRKFDEASNNDPPRATYFLTKMQELYAIERECHDRELDFDARKKVRQEKSLTILDELETWLKVNAPDVLPKSAIGQAIAYTLSLWWRLKRYVEDGRYEIDNNLIENSIRPVALGRKNYLFAGSHEAAQRAAMIYSFLGSCKLNNVNPAEWLTYVLKRLPDYKANRIEELLPHKWKNQQCNHSTLTKQ
jgi:transposase